MDLPTILQGRTCDERSTSSEGVLGLYCRTVLILPIAAFPAANFDAVSYDTNSNFFATRFLQSIKDCTRKYPDAVAVSMWTHSWQESGEIIDREWHSD